MTNIHISLFRVVCVLIGVTNIRIFLFRIACVLIELTNIRIFLTFFVVFFLGCNDIRAFLFRIVCIFFGLTSFIVFFSPLSAFFRGWRKICFFVELVLAGQPEQGNTKGGASGACVCGSKGTKKARWEFFFLPCFWSGTLYYFLYQPSELKRPTGVSTVEESEGVRGESCLMDR